MEEELRKALGTVTSQDDNLANMPQAITYARACLVIGMEGLELKTQLLYVLTNLTYWRGEEAKETKAILKKYSK